MSELLDILNKVKPGIDYVNEKHLVSDELIDSLDVMTIVTEICDEFDVEILPTDVVPENFEFSGQSRTCYPLVEPTGLLGHLLRGQKPLKY